MSLTDMIENLVLASSVTTDSALPDDIKNIIIDFQAESVTFIGSSPFITLKHKLTEGTYTVTKDNFIEYFNIKSKEIIGFLASFKNSKGSVILENVSKNTQIKCTVFIEGEPYGAVWVLDNIPMKNSTKAQVTGVSMIGTLYDMEMSVLKTHLATMYPILQKDTTLYGYLTFGTDHIIAYNPYYTLIQNKNENIPSTVFSNIRIYYKYINFILKNIVGLSENVKVTRTERHICFLFEELNIECYIAYDTKVVDYQNYLNLFTKQHYVTINKTQLENASKRAALLKDDILQVTIVNGNNYVELKNSKCVQAVPISEIYNMGAYPNLSFSIMPKVINAAILDTDKEIENINLYYCPTTDNDIIAFSDTTNSWFSLLRIKATNTGRNEEENV